MKLSRPRLHVSLILLLCGALGLGALSGYLSPTNNATAEEATASSYIATNPNYEGPLLQFDIPTGSVTETVYAYEANYPLLDPGEEIDLDTLLNAPNMGIDDLLAAGGVPIPQTDGTDRWEYTVNRVVEHGPCCMLVRHYPQEYTEFWKRWARVEITIKCWDNGSSVHCSEESRGDYYGEYCQHDC